MYVSMYEQTHDDVWQSGDEEFPFVAVGRQTIPVLDIKSVTDRLRPT